MRIKRLVYPQASVRTIKEKLVPGTVLLLTVICLTWYSHRVPAQWMPLQHKGKVKEKYRRLLDEIYGENSTGELEFRH